MSAPPCSPGGSELPAVADPQAGPHCLGQTGSPQPTFSNTGKYRVLAFFTTKARLSSFSSRGLNAASATISMRSRVPSAYMSILTNSGNSQSKRKLCVRGFLIHYFFFGVTSKYGKLSSGHRTGKGQFSFQSQRKAMPKNAQTTAQLHSSHTLVK